MLPTPFLDSVRGQLLEGVVFVPVLVVRTLELQDLTDQTVRGPIFFFAIREVQVRLKREKRIFRALRHVENWWSIQTVQGLLLSLGTFKRAKPRVGPKVKR